jgi:hypothetical protein
MASAAPVSLSTQTMDILLFGKLLVRALLGSFVCIGAWASWRRRAGEGA